MRGKRNELSLVIVKTVTKNARDVFMVIIIAFIY